MLQEQTTLSFLFFSSSYSKQENKNPKHYMIQFTKSTGAHAVLHPVYMTKADIVRKYKVFLKVEMRGLPNNTSLMLPAFLTSVKATKEMPLWQLSQELCGIHAC